MVLNLFVYFYTALKSRNKTWTLCKSGQAEGGWDLEFLISYSAHADPLSYSTQLGIANNIESTLIWNLDISLKKYFGNK